jgi:hypothetical protein
MSSFVEPHHLYVFRMKNGKKKLAYGPSPELAFEYLKLRLTASEIALVDPSQHEKITQRLIREHVRDLG